MYNSITPKASSYQAGRLLVVGAVPIIINYYIIIGT